MGGDCDQAIGVLGSLPKNGDAFVAAPAMALGAPPFGRERPIARICGRAPGQGAARQREGAAMALLQRHQAEGFVDDDGEGMA